MVEQRASASVVETPVVGGLDDVRRGRASLLDQNDWWLRKDEVLSQPPIIGG
jgi:hypothetical protein